MPLLLLERSVERSRKASHLPTPTGSAEGLRPAAGGMGVSPIPVSSDPPFQERKGARGMVPSPSTRKR
jgi:hypothetical protein